MKPAKSKKTYTMNRGGIMIGNEGQEDFNQVQLTKPDGSFFDLTHSVTMTGNIGKLMPVMVQECYPGEKYRIRQELLVRFQPMLAPAMQRFDGIIENFFVPARIIWEDFEKFMKGDAVTLPFLTLDAADTAIGTTADYIGIPQVTGANTLKVQATPFAAIQRIFHEYYRNQNLSTMTDDDKPFALTGDNAAQKAMLLTLRDRAYRHDYFTSALPFTQKGTEATIDFNFNDVPVAVQQQNPPSGDTFAQWQSSQLPSATNVNVGVPIEDNTGIPGGLDPNNLFAKTSALSGTAFTINDFRLALATQHWLERMAVGGTRYVEIIRAHFGVTTSDQRLQRPEFIGGMKTPVVISEVLQTSETSVTPQGYMSGHGIAAGFTSDDDNYYCEEHGWIISILSIVPKAVYVHGLERSLSWEARNTRDEWYWPQFANLGEQAIKNSEVFADTVTATQTGDWGYTGRFNELRYKQSRICGQLKSSMQFWTGARMFSALPPLSEAFITQMANDTNKLFIVDPDATNPELVIHILHDVAAFKLMPKYAVPELVG